MGDRQVFYYRCPKCHHIVEKGQLFNIGCPICGWVSPLKEGLIKKGRQRRREPLIDVFDEKGYLRIVAELPEVEEDDIEINLDGYLLIISVPNQYYKEVELPYPAKGDAKTTFNNGVLEVIVKK